MADKIACSLMLIIGLFVSVLLNGHTDLLKTLIIALLIFLVGILIGGALEQKDKKILSSIIISAAIGMSGGLVVGFAFTTIATKLKITPFLVPVGVTPALIIQLLWEHKKKKDPEKKYNYGELIEFKKRKG